MTTAYRHRAGAWRDYQGHRSGQSATPIISRNRPAFGNTTKSGAPSGANNGTYGDGTSWKSNGYPAIWSVDLSAVTAATRAKLYLVWNDTGDTDYDTAWASAPTYNKPGAYTIDGNTAAGGTAPPSTGWQTLVTVTGNTRRARGHLFNAVTAGGVPYTWIRINATAGAATNDPTAVDCEIKVEIASGANNTWDTWLFLGDSITAGGISIAQNYYGQFAALRTDYTPVVAAGGAGGLAASHCVPNGTANALFLSWLDSTPATHVTLNLGTNDVTTDATAYLTNMTYLVNQVLGRGKIPVVPKIPWGNGQTTAWYTSAQSLNAQIDALWASFGSQVIHGPDFYVFYSNNQSLIQANNVHPTAAGYAAWAQQYAQSMAANAYPAVGS